MNICWNIMQEIKMHNIRSENHEIFSPDNTLALINRTKEPIIIVRSRINNEIGLLPNLANETLKSALQQYNLNLIAISPPVLPENFGNNRFVTQHGLQYPYIVGEMANGVATARMVIAAAKSGMFGFFGAAGLMPADIEKNLLAIRAQLGNEAKNWGSNLIYMPHEPDLEAQIVDLYLGLNVRCVSASAYMTLSPDIIRYAATGLSVNARGKIIRRNYVIAKLSRPEVAQQFISPPPKAILDNLVAQGKLSFAEANLASKISIADSITVEADSGGHTDNRPLAGLYSTIHKLSLELAHKYNYEQPVFIGVAGGLGTPASVAAAFSLGADYVLTGSINAAAIESGFSDDAKNLLSKAELVDVMMAPAADMFELGVKVQILKRGTLFGQRALKLYQLYQNYDSLEAIPEQEIEKLEQQIFHDKLENIWASTREFFILRNPKEIARAERDPKHLMALVFRWYLGQSTRWAIKGDVSRRMDYQVWCGPAIGAFNSWVAGSFLEDLSQRNVVQIGRNLLEGAAVIMRAQHLRSLGMQIPGEAFYFKAKLFS